MNDMAFNPRVSVSPPHVPARRARPLMWLGLLLGAFLLGSAAALLLVARWDHAPELLGVRPPAPVRVVAPVTAVPVITAGGPALDARMAALEERLSLIDARARAAAGNAGRAEGLLVAFAARRALDRGVSLGYLEGLLRDRFGAAQPGAVALVIGASRRPVTLDRLKLDLAEAAPALADRPAGGDWWQATKRELSELVTVRRAGAPSSLPTERVQFALSRLDAGQVDVALAEVLRLPTRDAAGPWVDEARRYVQARRALDMIETAALLDTAPAPAPPAA